MMQRTFLSSLSLAALFLGSAAPAAAYVFGGDGLSVESIHGRLWTNRDVTKNAAQNGPLVGSILPFGLDRAAAEPGYTGRHLLILRSYDRWDSIDNARRHRLGQDRGGDWRIMNVAGDSRRRPSGLSFGDTLAQPELPPTLVSTGGDDGVTYDRPTRRDIRENGMFGVKDRNRNTLQEMQESSR